MSIKQSISWWCFVPEKMSAAELIETAAEIGYPAVELVTEEYFQQIKDAGLEIVSINGHRPIEDGLNKRENLPRIKDEIAKNLELAVKWGVSNLICFSGNRGEVSDDDGLAITAENLAVLGEMAESAGVTRVLELLNSKVDHPHYQCDHTAWGVEVCRRVDSPRVKLLYDIYHMQIMEGDIIRTIRENHAYFGHYHTAGVPGRNEIGTTQELYYPAIVDAIIATGYNGYLGQELIPLGDPRVALQEAFDLCNR